MWQHRLPKLPFTRREFVASGILLPLFGRFKIPDDNADLLALCESVMKTASARVLDDLWDEHGQETRLDAADTQDLWRVFKLFVESGAKESEFLLTSRFVNKPTSSNGVDFVLPYADSNGVPLDVLLTQRITARPVPMLITRAGKRITDYVEPIPTMKLPAPAKNLYIAFEYSGSEEITASTFPTSVGGNSGQFQITLSTGFIRRVMQSCIYAYPVIRNTRTLLWPNLEVVKGPSDSILVQTDTGPTSITLLPLLGAVDSRIYSFKTNGEQIAAVMKSFHNVFVNFVKLRKGEALGKDVDVTQLREDIDILSGLFEVFFLTAHFILCHEVAHAVYLHEETNDQKRNYEQEMIADQAAILHLLVVALTQCLDATHSWTQYWNYSLIGSEALNKKLLWFERLFGFAVAINIALNLLGGHSSATHPEDEDRWQRSVRVWNNCVLAFSNVTTFKR